MPPVHEFIVLHTILDSGKPVDEHFVLAQYRKRGQD
jgi:hypothetical protein